MEKEIFYSLTFFVKIFITLNVFTQVSGVKVPLKWYIITSVFLRVLFLLVPPLAYFATFLFLVIALLYLNLFQSRILDIFYGLYPIVIESIFGDIIKFVMLPKIGISLELMDSLDFSPLIVEVLIWLIYMGITKLLLIDFTSLQKGFSRGFLKYAVSIVNLTMAVYFIILQYTILSNSNRTRDDILNLRLNLSEAYCIIFLVFMVYLNGSIKNRLEEEINNQRNKQLEDLSNYSHQIESLYNEIRSFRHDYANILISLKSGIDEGDLNKIKTIYDNVLAQTGKQIQSDKYDLTRLVVIKDDAIKSIISAKIIEAKNQEIKTTVEVGEINQVPMDTLDFVTVLSTIFDNAIEAALASDEPSISFSFFSEKSDLVLILENSTLEETLDTRSIFEVGHSSKGEGRGIGLANVNQILKKYDNTTLKTSSKNFTFRQELLIFTGEE